MTDHPPRSLFETFAENITQRPPTEIYGREAEVGQVLTALASPLKGRVVVLGAARVGKSAVIQSAAHAIANGQAPTELKGKQVWRFNPANLPGLGVPGQWQSALEQFLTEWSQRPEVILFIEDLVGASRVFASIGDDSRMNLAYALGNALLRFSGLCLAEAEDNAWRRLSDTFPNFQRLFLSVRVPEPDLYTARGIIQRVADDLGLLHTITIQPEAIEQALDLNQRYALDRAQPGKTIDLLQDALAVTRPGPGAVLTASKAVCPACCWMTLCPSTKMRCGVCLEAACWRKTKPWMPLCKF